MMTSSNGNIFRVTGHLCGNSPVPGEFPAQRPVTRSFDVFFDLHLNKRLSKQSWGWWFETLSRPFWRHRNVLSLSFHEFTYVAITPFICTLPLFHQNKGQSHSYSSGREWEWLLVRSTYTVVTEGNKNAFLINFLEQFPGNLGQKHGRWCHD